MAGTVTFYKGQNVALTVEDSTNVSATSQLQDFGGVAIASANKGLFWKVNSISFTPTQNTEERAHVGTDEEDTIATTKNYEVSIDMDWYTAGADVTLVDGATTYHAVDPLTVLKQVVNGDGECYDLTLHIGCDVTGTIDGEDYALPSTSDFKINMTEVVFTTMPYAANPGGVSSASMTLMVKSADIA